MTDIYVYSIVIVIYIQQNFLDIMFRQKLNYFVEVFTNSPVRLEPN